MTDLTEIVTKVINDECDEECGLVQSQITRTELSCTIENTAAYRAALDIDTGENCTQLISILGDWIRQNPSVLVQQSRLRIAPYCDVEFESFEVPSDCVRPTENSTGTTTTHMAFTDNTFGLTKIELIIVAAIGGGIGLLVIIAVLVVCCVIAVKVCRWKQSM